MTTAERPFDLIEAKLARPVLRVETVVKSELIGRIGASSARAVSVVAPAGFGKTTLLAHLVERDGRSFATVALDDRDNDPVVLLRYVAAALDRLEPVRRRCSRRSRRPAGRSGRPAFPASARRSPRCRARRAGARRPASRHAIRRASTRSPRSLTTSRRDPRSCCRAGRSPRCRWPACGRRDACWRSARTTSAWTPARRRRYCATRASTSATPTSLGSQSGPRAGRPASTSPRCRSGRAASKPKRPGGSAATTASWPTTCGSSCCRG